MSYFMWSILKCSRDWGDGSVVKTLSAPTTVWISGNPHEFQVGKACPVTTVSEGRRQGTPRAN